MSKDSITYEINVHADESVADVSDTLYGLFFEDINHAADGGIYAEMIQNRSFEDFEFNTYDANSGEDGKSTGRKYNPLHFWFGDTDKVEVRDQGGLNEAFGLTDTETNIHYISAHSGVKLYNYGFCDNRMLPSMQLRKDNEYHLSLYGKCENEKAAIINITLMDAEGNTVSNTVSVTISSSGWEKLEADVLVAHSDTVGKIEFEFGGDCDIDMISMMPGNVWGAVEETDSPTAHDNYLANSNYRLRRDLVEALKDLHPTFLRFPGGCISEGSFIWDNVYDWKDSVGDVATRKENYNVWGYVMTMGLGYMEYFQLAEDLGALPLPVMACGVLCQARSDYANPAGGSLREKYISNFTDLIDFAISMDFENNEWAKLRKDMGHEKPFPLHHLGVGNENWGSEFFANFEIFRESIDRYMADNYPDYELHIVSTAGAQADDDAYQEGWRFLAGYKKGGDLVSFTDGEKSTEEKVTWYPYRSHHMDTIVDEHYYRANDYLLENVDRYNYYQREYLENGLLDESRTPKVFVGEYASNEKNTMAGAVAEAAVMTGFENNSDVVRMAATAPLFNKIEKDETYRWTPDCIWFDDEKVWKTPTYYVQQLFAEHIGKKVLKTDFYSSFEGEKRPGRPEGGIIVAARGEALLEKVRVLSESGDEIFVQDFSKDISSELKALPDNSSENIFRENKGIRMTGEKLKGFYLDKKKLTRYKVELIARKLSKDAVIMVFAGVQTPDGDFSQEQLSAVCYCIGDEEKGSGLKVFKDGKEGYTMGDYASSVYAGNLRACFKEPIPENQELEMIVDYGASDPDKLDVYTGIGSEKAVPLSYKLKAYNRQIFSSATADDDRIYIKLVNADPVTKNVRLNVTGNKLSEAAKLIDIGGDAEKSSVPNVNSADEEVFKPVTSEIHIKDGSAELVIPPCSVSVIVAEKG